MALVLTLPFGEPVYSALEMLVAAAKADDPLAPITVVVPSNYAGLALRRRMGAAGGVVNVRFLVISRLAELLGAPRLSASRRPLTAWTRSEAIRASLIGHRGVFGEVATHPATERALEATFRDLRLAPPGALEHVATVSRRSADVVGLYRRFRRLTAGTYDIEDLAYAAAEAVDEGAAAMADVGRVVLYLPRGLSPGEETLMRRLLDRDGADIVFGVTHDRQADEATLDLAARLGASVPPAPPDSTPVRATAILRAIDAEEEVRSVIRLIIGALKEGTELYRIGVLFSSSEDYAALVQEQFRAASIPFNGPPVRPLGSSMAGRVLLGMLKLPETQFRRSAMMEWLTSGPILESREGERAGRWVPSRRWDEISRDAGVVKGMGQWRGRIGAWLRDERRRPGELDTGTRLLAFVEELQTRLQPPRVPSMDTLGGWATRLLDRYLGSETMASGWEGTGEADAYTDLRKRLDAIANEPPPRDPDSGEALSLLAGRSPEEVRAAFVQALEASLQQATGRLGRFGDGVFIGSLAAARGMHFDRLFVLGAVEGLLPTSTREDPLLPDSERETAQIPSRDSRTATMRADYLAALAASKLSTLCFSQSSLRAQAKQIPSRWLLESASALAGAELSSEAMESIGAQPWLTTIASFEQALGSRALDVASSQEWELRSLLRCASPEGHFLRTNRSFADSLQAMSVRLPRWSRRIRVDFGTLSPWAGGVGPGLSLDTERRYSPTSFQTLATCGFRYFLQQVARVKETERPEEITRISAAERGNIIHEVLERFLAEVKDEGRSPRPGETWGASDRARLLAIAGEECDRAYHRGITGGELLWRMDRARIRRDLSLFLDSDARVRAETGATFLQAERAFGTEPDDDLPGGVPWPAVSIPLKRGNAVAFRGRIDRVDIVQSVERTKLIVYDYKSGSAYDYKSIESGADRLVAGTQLQLPIYSLAVREALGDASTPVVAKYWFISEREQFHQIGYELTLADEENLSRTLGVLAAAVDGGTFPPVPGKASYDARRQRSVSANCKYCAFDRVCAGGDRARAWAERSMAAELSDYVALAAPRTAEGNGENDVDD